MPKCVYCGAETNLVPFACDSCYSKWKNASSTPPVTGFAYKKLNNGHFLVGFKGDLDNNHWHLAPDGIVLSVKEGGHHLFRRTDVTRDIRNICPDLDVSFLWEG